MSSNQDRIDTSSRLLSGFREIEKWHPYKMLAHLMLLGSFLVMIFLLITFTIESIGYHDFLNNIELPKFFIVAAVAILVGGYFKNDVIRYYHEDDIDSIRKQIFRNFLLGTVFLVFQFVGWLELVFQGLTFKSNVIATYLYLITGFHMIHVLTALVYGAYFLFKTKDTHIDPVGKLLYFTSPHEKTQLEVLKIFWNYISFSWIFLFIWLVFLI
jgi:cytochrome c oxidase subunit 3